jgi:hypothetical protein
MAMGGIGLILPNPNDCQKENFHMDELKNKTVCVYDHGAFFHVTQRLSRDFGRTLFFKPWKKSNPVFTDMAVGTGFENIERVVDFFDIIDEVDLFVFPGLYNADLQIYLESKGRRVWGSRRGEDFEFKRQFFKDTLKRLGLPVPEYVVLEGMTKLVEYLKENENVFVKISRFRGDGETWHHINYKLSESRLDGMRFYYGPFKEKITFVVEHEIKSDIEAAYDGFSVDGKFPDLGIHGYEAKDRAYVGTLQPYDEMPKAVIEVNEAFAPLLAKEKYRSAWGTEIRIDDKGDNYFGDATCRTQHPPGALFAEQVTNYSQIMYYGADGELVQIEHDFDFAAELILLTSGSDISFQALEIPKNVEPFVKLFSPCKHDGITYVCPESKHPLMNQSDEIGSVVAMGDTMEEAIETVQEFASQIKGASLYYESDALAKCVKSIQSAKDEGMKMTDQAVPDPSSVVE